MPSVCDARRNILPDRTNFLVPPPFGAWGSFSMPAKIAINGYGTIGKRVADAVALQDDMRLVGVAKTKPDFEAKLAVRKAYAVYAANKEALAKFEKAGVKAAGILDDLVNEADLVVDCTPEESGYKALYEKAGVQSVLPDLDIHTIAVKVPTTIMHLHTLAVDLKKSADATQILDVWKRFARIMSVSGGDGVKSTAQIMEMARDLSRSRSDLYEIAVWRDGVDVVDGTRLYYFQAVHQEADVVPENVDAIRALLELEKDGRNSMEKTERSLSTGIAKEIRPTLVS